MKLSTIRWWLELSVRLVFDAILAVDEKLTKAVEAILGTTPVDGTVTTGKKVNSCGINVHYKDVKKASEKFSQSVLAMSRAMREQKKARIIIETRKTTEEERKALEVKASEIYLSSYRNTVIEAAKNYIPLMQQYCKKISSYGTTFRYHKQLCSFISNDLIIGLNDIHSDFIVDEWRTIINVASDGTPVKVMIPVSSITEIVGNEVVYFISGTSLGFDQCPPTLRLTKIHNKLTADEEAFAKAKDKDKIILILITTSSSGLKDNIDRHAIYVTKEIYEKYYDLFNRTNVLKNVDYVKWASLITEHDYAVRAEKSIINQIKSEEDETKRSELQKMRTDATTRVTKANHELKTFVNSTKKEKMHHAKWTTQKMLQSIQLAFTPSSNTGLTLTSENTIFVFSDVPCYDTPNSLAKLVNQVSGKNGITSITPAKVIKQLGHDGDIWLSRKWVEKQVASGNIKNVKACKKLLKDGCGQIRMSRGAHGYAAVKGFAVVLNIPFNVLNQNSLKDWFLYGDKEHPEEVAKNFLKLNEFGEDIEIRLMATEQKAGKLQFGRQVTEGLSEITDDEIRRLIGINVDTGLFEKLASTSKLDTIGAKIAKYSNSEKQYASTMCRKVKNIVDLPNHLFRWFRAIWTHPGFKMSAQKEIFARHHKCLAGNGSAYGIYTSCVGDVHDAIREIASKYPNLNFKYDEEKILKANEIRVPKGSGLRPFAEGSDWRYDKPVESVIVRYPYTSPLYVIVTIVGESDGAYCEFSMEREDITALALAADFDGDHVYIFIEPALISAAKRSNKLRMKLGFRYTLYDDNKPEDNEDIDYCHISDYIFRAPDLGNAGRATKPVFLLNSLIPTSWVFEEDFSGDLNSESPVFLPEMYGITGETGYVCIIEKEITDKKDNSVYKILVRESYEEVVSEYGEDVAKETVVRIKDIVFWLMMVCADITGNVDAVKRAAKSPYMDTIQGKRLKSFMKGLIVASEPHDHPFNPEKISLLDDIPMDDSSAILIPRSTYCCMDRWANILDNKLGTTNRTMTKYKDYSVSEGGFVLDINTDDYFKWSNGWIDVDCYEHSIDEYVEGMDRNLVSALRNANRISFIPEHIDNLEDYSCGCGIRFGEDEDPNKTDYTKVNAAPWRGTTKIDLTAGAWTMRCLRALTRREHQLNAADPRSKFKLAQKAFEAGRMVVAKWAEDNKYGELSDELCDILLYNSIMKFILDSGVTDVTGEELMFVLGWYSKEEIEGQTNNHRYLYETLKRYDEEISFEEFEKRGGHVYEVTMLGLVNNDEGDDGDDDAAEEQ